jgi:hypothetical protein
LRRQEARDTFAGHHETGRRESEMQPDQKELIEKNLLAARKIVRDALRKCQADGVHPAAVAQVLGENAVQLMIRNFGPDAGKDYCKSLSQEAVRLAHHYRTHVAPAAEPD